MKEKPKTVDFLDTGIWLVREGDISGVKRFFLRLLKVLLLSIRGYSRNNLRVRGAALTFYTFLSVVPVVAVAFGISKGFGLDKSLQETLLTAFSEQEEILTLLFGYANAVLDKTNGGIVAGAGLALLLWTIINLLDSVEEAFNNIWKVPKPRSFGRKTADYISFALIGPIFLIMAASATVALMSRMKIIATVVADWGVPSFLVLTPLRLIPFVIVWSLFSLLFIWMPNTRVRWSAGIIAGITAGTAYQIVQWAYFTFQIGVSRNNAIYGSLAAIPLFLAWMQINWLIILVGAEISSAIQNMEFPEDMDKVSLRRRKILAVLIMREIAKRFIAETGQPTLKEIAATLKAPSLLIGNILSHLSGAGLVTPVKPHDKNTGETWLPGKDIRQMTVASVLDAIDRGKIGKPDLPTPDEFSEIAKDLSGMMMDAEKANRPILDL